MTTTTNVDRWKVEAYMANTFMTAEQTDSRLTPFSRTTGGLVGEKVMLEDQYGNASDVVEQLGRAEPTGDGTVDHDRTWVHFRRWKWDGPLMDRIDSFQMIHEIESPYRSAGSASIARKYDDLLIAAIFGARYTGRDGTTTTAFPTTALSGSNYSAAYVIPVDYEGSATGLTVEKLLVAQTILEAREVLKDGDPIVVGTSAVQRLNLKRQIEVISGDFTAQMVLDSGDLRRWGRFQFARTERLPVDGSSYRRCPIWIPRYLVRAMWEEIEGGIRVRPDRSDATQLYFKFAMNATRSHEEGFVELLAAE